MKNLSIIQRAIAHGAMGYIPKSAHPSHIGEAIRQVLEGEICLAAKFTSQHEL